MGNDGLQLHVLNGYVGFGRLSMEDLTANARKHWSCGSDGARGCIYTNLHYIYTRIYSL